MPWGVEIAAPPLDKYVYFAVSHVFYVYEMAAAGL